MRPTYCLIAATLISIGLLSAAKAQTTDTFRPFTIKLGALISPSGTNTTYSARQNIEPCLDVSYEFGNARVRHPFLFGAYFDYVFAAPKTNLTTIYPYPPTDVEKVKSMTSGYGLGLSTRYLLGTSGTAVIPYVGAGLGLYSAQDASENTAILGGQASGVSHISSDDRIVGGKILLGIETRSGFLIEANHQFFPYKSLDGVGGANLSGTEFAVGYRF